MLYGGGEYNSKRFLNKAVSQGYLPLIKPKKINPKGFGARIRNEVYDEEEFKERSICEGFFDALTNWPGDEVPCFLYNTTIARISLRVAAYALRMLLRINIR